MIKYFFIISILFLTIFFIRFYNFEKKIGNSIYPFVYVNKKDFGLKSKDEVFNYFKDENNKLKKITFVFLFNKTPVATFSGSQINLHYDSAGISQKVYLVGRSTNILMAYYQKISIMLWKKIFEFAVFPDFDQDQIKEIIFHLEEVYNKPAQNALFKFENGRVVSFREEKSGERILTKETISELEEKIKNLIYHKTNRISITIKSEIIEPEITLVKINNYGIKELIGQGQSDFSHSIFERIYNIKLAASKFNGVLILKDKVLSFNETVGDISSLTGYKPAYIIKDGKTILGDGGGVCQVSTTLFRAALNAGLEILERYPHAYRVSYYENDSLPGFDATVFAPTTDLKIKNNTGAAILIQTEVDESNNLLYFRLYGKKDDRVVEIEKPLIWDVVPPPPPKYQDDPNLKKGVIKQIDFPAWGAKVNFKYKVKFGNKKTEEKEIFSFYKPWQAVYLVGTAD